MDNNILTVRKITSIHYSLTTNIPKILAKISKLGSTRLKPTIVDVVVKIDNYTLLRRDRPEGNGGGTAI